MERNYSEAAMDGGTDINMGALISKYFGQCRASKSHAQKGGPPPERLVRGISRRVLIPRSDKEVWFVPTGLSTAAE